MKQPNLLKIGASFALAIGGSYLSLAFAFCGIALFWSALGKRTFIMSWLFFSAIQAVSLFWLCSIEYQGIFMLLVYGLLCLVLGLEFALFTQLVMRKRTWIDLIGLSGLWFLIECSHQFWFCGFTWSYLGLYLGKDPASLQLASVLGIEGLSFWIILVNLILYRWIQEGGKLGLVWMGLSLFPMGFGLCRLGLYEENHSAPSRKVALVQTAIKPHEKTSLLGRKGEFVPASEQWDRILKLLGKYDLQGIDLLVLPESTVSYEVDRIIGRWGKKNQYVTNAFFCSLLQKRYGAPVIAGFDEESGGCTYNAAFWFGKNGMSSHRKTMLLPLAEYLPFEWCREISRRYGIKEFYSLGRGISLLGDEFKVALSICCEETSAAFMRKAGKDADFFVNISNDYWYPRTNLAEKHLELARFRAVENGLYLFRACNSGVSAVINPLGEEKRLLGEESFGQRAQPGVLIWEGKVGKIKTLYGRFGNYYLGLFALGIIYSFFPALRKKACIL